MVNPQLKVEFLQLQETRMTNNELKMKIKDKIQQYTITALDPCCEQRAFDTIEEGLKEKNDGLENLKRVTYAEVTLVFLLLFVPFLIKAQDINPKLSKKEAIEDIRFLKHKLEQSHPGMHRFTSKETMDEAYSQSISTIDDIYLFKFYGEVSKLLSYIRCGHTQADLPNRTSNLYLDELSRIPFEVSFLDGKMVVAKDYSDQPLERGTEILSIDGKKSEELVLELFQRLNGDGYVESFKYKYLEYYFWLLYPLYYTEDGLPSSYTIEYRKPFEDVTRKVVLSGLSPFDIEEMKEKESKNEKPRSLKIEEDYALLTIKTFTGGKSDRYYSFLKRSFEKINQSGVENLIVDLRDNDGGADDYGAEFVRYLADGSFNYFDRIEVTEHYANQNERVKSKNGRHFWPDHPGLKKWSPAEQRFEGNVYVLINGISFSTTADVASVIYDNDWATFIGQETGGGAYGNTSGHSTSIRLPNSKIVVDLPYWMYFTALKKEYPKGRGVIPQYVTSLSLQEFIDGTDVEMQKALSLIGGN